MPQICFTRRCDGRTEMYFAEAPRGMRAGKSCSSHSAALTSIYESLPHHLMSCFDYCCIVFMKCGPILKDELIRLLLGESLIPEKQGEIIETTANNIIQELIHRGLLESINSHQIGGHRGLALTEVDEMEFLAKAATLPVRAIVVDWAGNDIFPDFGTLQIRSLFWSRYRGLPSFGSKKRFSRDFMTSICKLKYLLVLELGGEIQYLPDEVGDLAHLRYLRLYFTGLNQLPQTLGNLQNLLTLDIRMCGWYLKQLPIEVINIQQLRHLLISRKVYNREIRVPKEITKLKNLITLTRVYAGGGTANELSKLTQLRELGVKCVSDEHASELCSAIMKMENLIFLSLEVERFYTGGKNHSLFPEEFEQFSPPSLLQELHLCGGLVETPAWLFSMPNLTTLCLYDSNLLESPTLILQFLPKLKHLYLQEAYETRLIGKEFCQAGGFPELETLAIFSRVLVEWSEIVNGAFPKLKILQISCNELRFLPEGLQNIATLEEVELHVHGDLVRRLKGEENYKVKQVKNSDITSVEKSVIFVLNPWDDLSD